MIKTEELRIGNYVYTRPDNDQAKISGVLLSEIRTSFGTHGLHFVDPIPLTKDWLIKFGFKKVEKHTYRISNKNIDYDFIIGEKFDITNGNCGFMGLHVKEEMIFSPTEEDLDNKYHQQEETIFFSWNKKYVHQLQNLFYALTGEELK